MNHLFANLNDELRKKIINKKIDSIFILTKTYNQKPEYRHAALSKILNKGHFYRKDHWENKFNEKQEDVSLVVKFDGEFISNAYLFAYVGDEIQVRCIVGKQTNKLLDGYQICHKEECHECNCYVGNCECDECGPCIYCRDSISNMVLVDHTEDHEFTYEDFSV